jgi:hypothetical protein
VKEREEVRLMESWPLKDTATDFSDDDEIVVLMLNFGVNNICMC